MRCQHPPINSRMTAYLVAPARCLSLHDKIQGKGILHTQAINLISGSGQADGLVSHRCTTQRLRAVAWRAENASWIYLSFFPMMQSLVVETMHWYSLQGLMAYIKTSLLSKICTERFGQRLSNRSSSKFNNSRTRGAGSGRCIVGHCTLSMHEPSRVLILHSRLYG